MFKRFFWFLKQCNRNWADLYKMYGDFKTYKDKYCVTEYNGNLKLYTIYVENSYIYNEDIFYLTKAVNKDEAIENFKRYSRMCGYPSLDVDTSLYSENAMGINNEIENDTNNKLGFRYFVWDYEVKDLNKNRIDFSEKYGNIKTFYLFNHLIENYSKPNFACVDIDNDRRLSFDKYNAISGVDDEYTVENVFKINPFIMRNLFNYEGKNKENWKYDRK